MQPGRLESECPPASRDEPALFPMMTMPSARFLSMSKLKPHEEVLDSLIEFDEKMGKAMFVSHQWVTPVHPDPDFMQLRVLQKALQNIMSCRTQVSISVEVEIAYGRVKCPRAADFVPLYIWYDYFSCPQGAGAKATLHRELAISCIPAYVTKCVFCTILCPSLHWKGQTLNHATWAARGWCRLEQLASEVIRDDGYVIIIKTPDHPTLVWDVAGLCRPPGTGDFSFETDRQRVGQVVLQMVSKKMLSLLGKGELHKYRFLLNLQSFYLQGFAQQPLEGFVPGFGTEMDSDGDAFLVQQFLHDNCFRHILERDEAGWSPLCYAVLKGKCALVRALLGSRANANDFTTKSKASALPKHVPVLSLAVTYHRNEVMRLLLAAQANVNARCGFRATALAYTGVLDNASAVQILLQARADPSLKAHRVGFSPFRTACATGSVGVIQEMLRAIPEKVSLKFALHTALVFSGDSRTVSCLLDASANVNERLHIPTSKTVWWIFTRVIHARHFVSPSALTFLAYHHYGATPLMLSILTGKFEIIPTLLAAGARLDIPNDRGKTAADFLRQMDTPSPWSEGGISREDSDDTFTV